MRELRRRPHDDGFIWVSASDPANLLGTVLPGERIARVPGNRVLFRDGVPVATWVGDRFEALVELSGGDHAAALAVLTGRDASLQVFPV